MDYEDRYTDDTHGMAEPKSVLPPPLPSRLTVERMTEDHVEVEHPYPEVASAIVREDAVMTRSEYQRYQLQQETELAAYLQRLEDGRDEMLRYSIAMSHVFTKLTVRAAQNPVLARELQAACAYQDRGFLSLANTLDANPADFFEHLADFRRARLALESAGTSSP